MIKVTPNPFAHTRAALAVFDATGPERDKLWDGINCADDVHKAEARDKADAELVQRAFYEDTKAYNSLEDCLSVHVSSIRRCVK